MVRSAFIYFNQGFKAQSTQTLVSSTMVCTVLRIYLLIAKVEKSCNCYTEPLTHDWFLRRPQNTTILGNLQSHTVKICPVKISARVLLLPYRVISQEQPFLLGEEDREISGSRMVFREGSGGSIVANRV